MAERDDLEAILREIEKKHPNLVDKLSESIIGVYDNHARLIMVLTGGMSDDEREMRCYAYYLQMGYSPEQAEKEAKELLAAMESMDQTFH